MGHCSPIEIVFVLTKTTHISVRLPQDPSVDFIEGSHMYYFYQMLRKLMIQEQINGKRTQRPFDKGQCVCIAVIYLQLDILSRGKLHNLYQLK